MALVYYASQPERRAQQIVGDVLLICWILAWAWIAREVHDRIVGLGAPGETFAAAGDDLAERMSTAADTVSGLPALGEGLREPFDQLAEAGTAIGDAGRTQQQVVQGLSLTLAVALALLAAAFALALWIPTRLGFIRRASALQAYLDAGGGRDLLALRALTRLPLEDLGRLHRDPAAAWRVGDAHVIAELANLELTTSGLGSHPR